MTARRFTERRLLTASEAAYYFHLPPPQFRALGVGQVSFGATVLYDRAALDAWLDARSGLAPSTPARDDAEAALARFFGGPAAAARRP